MANGVSLETVCIRLHGALNSMPEDRFEIMHDLYRDLCKRLDLPDDDIGDVTRPLRIIKRIKQEAGAYLAEDRGGHVVVVREPFGLDDEPRVKLFKHHWYLCKLDGEWWIADPSTCEGDTD